MTMSRARVCKREDIPANGMKAFDISGGLKVLIANAGGDFYAYQGICPHQEVCLDEGFFDGSTLTCHQHLWQWDIRSGAPIGLAEAPLEPYAVEVAGDEVFVLQSSALRAAELFNGVPSAMLDRFDQLARREEVGKGRILYNVGDVTDDFYVLDSGRVEFSIGRDERTSAAGFMLKKGEVFGWAALLDAQPRRIARAVCIEDSVVFRLNGIETLKVLETDTRSAYLVMRKLSTLITRYLTSEGSK